MLRILILSFFVLFQPINSFAADKKFLSYFHEEPRKAPILFFEDKKGKRYGSEEFKGKVILINLWATWCRPCVKEMPSLDALQKKGKKYGIYILPISIDVKPITVVSKFYERLGIKYLPVLKDFRNSHRNSSFAGIPTTVILNRKGQEVARVTGELDWDKPSILEALKKL